MRPGFSLIKYISLFDFFYLSMKELFLAETPGQQAVNQLLAILVTLAFAVVGGIITGKSELINN